MDKYVHTCLTNTYQFFTYMYILILLLMACHTPDLCIGYQYLSLDHIQISLLVVSYTMHLSFKNDSTLLGCASFLQLNCFCIVSCSQTAFFHFYLCRQKKGSGYLSIYFLCCKIQRFYGLLITDDKPKKEVLIIHK